jgi:hypothetical protein
MVVAVAEDWDGRGAAASARSRCCSRDIDRTRCCASSAAVSCRLWTARCGGIPDGFALAAYRDGAGALHLPLARGRIRWVRRADERGMLVLYGGRRALELGYDEELERLDSSAAASPSTKVASRPMTSIGQRRARR